MLCFNFILGLNFIFSLFPGMVMYDNDFKTKENGKKNGTTTYDMHTCMPR